MPVAAADLARITDRFASRRSGGFGLGLHIARQIAQQAGGRLVAMVGSRITRLNPARALCVALATALVLNALFILGGWRILRRTEEQAIADHYKAERKFFRLSLYYLFLHFLALLLQHWIGAW